MKKRLNVVRCQLVRDHSVSWQHEPRFTSPQQAADAARVIMGDTDREQFLVLLLDGKNRISSITTVSIDSLNQSVVHPREVFKPAILANAAAVLLVHNHPTGDCTPSPEDISITRRLKEAGDIMGIRVLDHIIVGTGFDDSDRTYKSFAESGLL